MALAASLPQRRISAAEYLQMIEAGILREDERVELLEGTIVEMTPIGMRHVAAVIRLVDLLREKLPREVLISVQNPVHLSDTSIPQPDLALLRRRKDFYKSALPSVADVLLLIEVSDTKLGYDRAAKMPLCAQAGVSEVWLIDVNAEQVEVHRQPTAEGYQSVVRLSADAIVEPVGISGVSIAVGELFV